MSMKPVLEQVAKGRRLAVRSIVMTALASMDCFVYRKQVVEATSGVDRHDESWGGLGPINNQDDHAIEYGLLGRAKLMLVEQFSGGRVFENNAAVDMDSVVVTGLVEPYDHNTPKNLWRCHLPNWELDIGDALMVHLGKSALIGFEVMDRIGSSAMADYGVRYVLAKRDELEYLEVLSAL